MSVAVDTRDHQRLAALHEANRIRTYRSILRADLQAAPNKHESLARLIRVLESNDPDLQTMRVGQILLSAAFLGPVAVRKLTRQAGAGPTLRLGDLTRRQRMALVELLRSPGEVWPFRNGYREAA
jgi:hypothetical protein